ncbi:hypothetical protein MMC18_002685 [Xylographa bjoerkii]|nr:hypothetical protein [Xylographa bjoerkii]
MLLRHLKFYISQSSFLYAQGERRQCAIEWYNDEVSEDGVAERSEESRENTEVGSEGDDNEGGIAEEDDNERDVTEENGSFYQDPHRPYQKWASAADYLCDAFHFLSQGHRLRTIEFDFTESRERLADHLFHNRLNSALLVQLSNIVGIESIKFSPTPTKRRGHQSIQKLESIMLKQTPAPNGKESPDTDKVDSRIEGAQDPESLKVSLRAQQDGLIEALMRVQQQLMDIEAALGQ